MVCSCWVPGCTNRANGTDKVGFYSIPSVRVHEGDFTKSLSEERRRLWLASVNRKDEPTKFSKICSSHFITGHPSSMYERSNPDWAPTLKLGEMLTPTKSQKKQAEIETKQKRFQRVMKRQETKEKHHAARWAFYFDKTHTAAVTLYNSIRSGTNM
uniref:THAP domain-containing protein 1 n=1 Tax=Knipowitschia caucasica TaxID=637954 RepID=A0AAV2KDQ1_KNICA